MSCHSTTLMGDFYFDNMICNLQTIVILAVLVAGKRALKSVNVITRHTQDCNMIMHLSPYQTLKSSPIQIEFAALEFLFRGVSSAQSREPRIGVRTYAAKSLDPSRCLCIPTNKIKVSTAQRSAVRCREGNRLAKIRASIAP